MLPVLQIGPLAIQTPGLVILLGLWLGLNQSEKIAPRFGVDPARFYTMMMVGIVAGLIGARAAYIARFPAAFSSNLLSILSPNPALFDLTAGLAAAFLAALIYGQRKGMAFWPTLDTLVPGLAILMIAVGFSHLASGRAFGSETDLPWGIVLWGARRHPAQIIEIILAAGAAYLAWPGSKKYRLSKKPPGWFFLTYISLYAGAVILLEAFRGDSLTTVGNFRLAQIGAWFVLAFAMITRSRQERTQETSGNKPGSIEEQTPVSH